MLWQAANPGPADIYHDLAPRDDLQNLFMDGGFTKERYGILCVWWRRFS